MKPEEFLSLVRGDVLVLDLDLLDQKTKYKVVGTHCEIPNQGQNYVFAVKFRSQDPQVRPIPEVWDWDVICEHVSRPEIEEGDTVCDRLNNRGLVLAVRGDAVWLKTLPNQEYVTKRQQDLRVTTSEKT